MPQKRVLTLCSMLLLASTVVLFSSFTDGSDSGGDDGDVWFAEATPVDCSTSQIVYQLVTSTGAGSGYLGVSATDGTVGGQVGGSGSGSSLYYGPKGTLYTQMTSTACPSALWGTCVPVPCHATGYVKFTPFPS